MTVVAAGLGLVLTASAAHANELAFTFGSGHGTATMSQQSPNKMCGYGTQTVHKGVLYNDYNDGKLGEYRITTCSDMPDSTGTTHEWGVFTVSTKQGRFSGLMWGTTSPNATSPHVVLYNDRMDITGGTGRYKGASGEFFVGGEGLISSVVNAKPIKVSEDLGLYGNFGL